MSYLGKGKKEELRILAAELGFEDVAHLKVIEIKRLITSAEDYDEELAKGILTNIIEENRVKAEEERVASERAFELERLKLQLDAQQATLTPAASTAQAVEPPRWELKRILPKFNPAEDDMAWFLNLFERQLRFMSIPESTWIPYLIGSLPSDIGMLIVREPEQEAQDYKKVKELLLKRFRLTADKYRQLFATHRKNPNHSWRDYFFELSSYFEGWLSELQIDDFSKLKDLIIADQIKRKVPPEVKEHYLDIWPNLNSPLELVEKLDTYDTLRTISRRNTTTPFQKKLYPLYEEVQKNLPPQKSYQSTKAEKLKTVNLPSKPALTCYGCGKVGFIKAKCPTCSPANRKTQSAQLGNFQISDSTVPIPVAVFNLTVNDIPCAPCADSGATHSIAGEALYQRLREEGAKFERAPLRVTLADGSYSEKEVVTTRVTICLEGRKFKLILYALPEARNNRTLLGVDFLEDAGIVLNLKTHSWFFSDKPQQHFQFFKGTPILSLRAGKIATSASPHLLRGDEGEQLSEEQSNRINALITQYESIFSPGGEPTPFIEHRIDTGDAPPVATTPYRLSPARKEILKKEIDALLASGVIEECDSPYAAPVVLIPKPNGEFRLCVDYRKLNLVTKSDPYPLPRMDDLLHNAKQTAFMSTLDLKAGYHQVKMYQPDKDKTAFVCQFGVYRFTRMPFGLKTAPATFQRLMDLFRNGLKATTLAYLDDIIILSETFEQHLEDLRSTFERLKKFKLHVNRKKCNFVCSKIKYLGHYITSSGIQVDPSKVEAITHIPPPKNVKQVQSFLQTCSWYRRFIPNFAEISKPLSHLTKKKTPWKWGKEEQQALETLKDRLVSPPVLKQVEETKPFVIRTDASSYALGAVLSQGHGPDEHPIEYASRLLTSAEKNYSTTEREALAVVWALEKFRGYIEGAEVTIASDHQPLRWLLSLKSPTGRLARWALQLQAYNIKVEYIAGKSNVVADMLSRPACTHDHLNCNICTVVLDLPARKSSDIRKAQLHDEDIKKIIECFESPTKDENYTNWTSRGYLMTQGILYRYAPDSESEEAQLVIPTQEREDLLKEFHDSPTGGHYGAEGTFHKIASRYYFPGMRKFVADYVKNCAACTRFKPSNQKPAGLLRTPAYAQRFETIAIDLFGPLPETPDGRKWIFIVEDTSTKWVELFALRNATAKECAVILLEEVFLRFGIPRRLISDNGTQFVSAVMQQVCFLLDVDQALTPVYWPQANPVECKNRDLKPRLAILVGNDHTKWSEKLPAIRFALNTARCETTNQTAAFLQFGRELRTVHDVKHDIRAIINNDTFVAEITPYLKRFAKITTEITDLVERNQDRRKQYADKNRRSAPRYTPGDKVWVVSHPVSNKSKRRTAKFAPRRDGPYIIITQKSPTTYEVANPASPSEPLGTYHASALKSCGESPQTDSEPVVPLRKRGRPRKTVPVSASNKSANLETPPTTAETVQSSVKTVNGRKVKFRPPANPSGYLPRRLRSQGGRL